MGMTKRSRAGRAQHIASSEVLRLEETVRRREAKLAEAQQKLAAAKTREHQATV